MSRIIKMVDEIKEYYNLNDTLLASDLGIMQQTIKGWRDGRKPKLPTYNKVKKMYEEMKQEVVDNSIVQRFEALEEKAEKKPYEVEVPEGIDDYVYINNFGSIFESNGFTVAGFEKMYKRGLTFKTVEEVEQYDKERILLFKMHKWAEEHNGGWTPDWEESDAKFYIYYSHNSESFYVVSNWNCNIFNKLPYFRSEELAQKFIEEFGDEIIEVLF